MVLFIDCVRNFDILISSIPNLGGGGRNILVPIL